MREICVNCSLTLADVADVAEMPFEPPIYGFRICDTMARIRMVGCEVPYFGVENLTLDVDIYYHRPGGFQSSTNNSETAGMAPIEIYMATSDGRKRGNAVWIRNKY